MRKRIMQIRIPALGLLLTSLSMPALAAQGEAPTVGITACDLLSNADVERVTGRSSTKPPSPLVEARNKWSQCSYRDASVWVGLFPASAAQNHVEQEVVMGGLDETRHAVDEVGDSAAIYYRAKGMDSRGLLLAYSGTRGVIVLVDMDPAQPSESPPLAVGLAKIALAKLK
jgi:hypothetical protein